MTEPPDPPLDPPLQVKSMLSKHETNTERLRVADLDANVEPDGGVSVNIIDEYQFQALKDTRKRSPSYPQAVRKSERYKANFKKNGEFPVTIRNKTRGVNTEFIVIKGKMHSRPLICKDVLLELGMLKTEPEGKLKEPDDLRIKTVKTSDRVEKLLTEYSNLQRNRLL